MGLKEQYRRGEINAQQAIMLLFAKARRLARELGVDEEDAVESAMQTRTYRWLVNRQKTEKKGMTYQ